MTTKLTVEEYIAEAEQARNDALRSLARSITLYEALRNRLPHHLATSAVETCKRLKRAQNSLDLDKVEGDDGSY